MNKKIIKNMFDKKINTEDIHNFIINTNLNKRKTNVLKIVMPSLLTICTIFLILISPTNNTNKLKTKNTNPDNTDKIYINDLDKNNNRETLLYDILFFGDVEETTLPNILPKFPMLKNIKVPENSNMSLRKYTWDPELPETSKSKKYTEYYLTYFNEYEEIEIYYNIEIFFSRFVKEKLRCLRLYKDSFKESTINGINVLIEKSGVFYGDIHIDKYYALFTYEGVNFDIEVQNISEEEFIELIKSIIS